MRIDNEEWNNPLGSSYLKDIRNSLNEENIAEYNVKFVGTGEYEINTEHFNVPDSLIITLHVGDESFNLTFNPLITISVVNGQSGTVLLSPAGTLSNNIDTTIPTVFALHQNYPNPFNPTTTFKYQLPEFSVVNISIYDMLGNLVKTLVNTSEPPGIKSVQWNATNNQGEPVSAGVYLYSIEAGDFRQTKKMILLK